MSPRAAWRLEGTGFGPAYDYAAGKMDWLAAELVGRFARRAVAAADESAVAGQRWHPGPVVEFCVEEGL